MNNTQESPVHTKAELYEILNERYSDHMGSKWDRKVINRTGMTVYDLRYKVAVVRVLGEWKYSDIRDTFLVSDGFIHKWSRVFAAHHELRKIFRRCNTQIKTRMQSKSNRPRSVSCPVRDRIRAMVIGRRRKYGFEGSDRIKAALELDVSTNTINKVLREEGMLDMPKKRHRDLTYGRYERCLPNDLWHTDYKSWICNGITYHSMWIIDDKSRFILGYHIDTRSSAEIAIDVISKAVEMFGKPRQILTDHGTEFYSVLGGKGRSALDRWCKGNGIEHIFSRVRHPQTNGKMERTHRSAKEEIPYFGSLETLEEAKKTFAKWIDYHNTQCPHQALGYDYPVNVYMSGCFIYKGLTA